ncbi:hypothetical protein DY138_01520 [Apilactobacillus timberlakei]|uniref:hypothetical protein n=1 Tax=Apilactobacillus timberlakei TaxID=2008380 RepID=UPI00112CAB82|nr:hypothetical protein [Apilactobacillus timberlakei]TPR20144.1 hypothetical protein DY138_01520 [Apilactobacillus timberlakei]TPR21862.1 hypothetical protein DY061_01435 [Apilactobacillus timberlakei]TPR22263.1 hypothetical protein DY083_04210 [Apilactobacillus timberlakei]TPR24036.1 hypothetical protein DY102_02920 [Apilactobacillus timberlakei]
MSFNSKGKKDNADETNNLKYYLITCGLIFVLVSVPIVIYELIPALLPSLLTVPQKNPPTIKDFLFFEVVCVVGALILFNIYVLIVRLRKFFRKRNNHQK